MSIWLRSLNLASLGLSACALVVYLALVGPSVLTPWVVQMFVAYSVLWAWQAVSVAGTLYCAIGVINRHTPSTERKAHRQSMAAWSFLIPIYGYIKLFRMAMFSEANLKTEATIITTLYFSLGAAVQGVAFVGLQFVLATSTRTSVAGGIFLVLSAGHFLQFFWTRKSKTIDALASMHSTAQLTLATINEPVARTIVTKVQTAQTFCHVCGTRLIPSARFCGNCGVELT